MLCESKTIYTYILLTVNFSQAHDSLVHPDHPLHKEGVDGVELFMGKFAIYFDLDNPPIRIVGTMHTGESRLLFSSAQVDYVRYWLHAMKLTDEVIPLPYSDCLFTESNLRTVSRVVYKDGGSLRSSIKVRILVLLHKDKRLI